MTVMRIVLYTKDIMIITGKSERTARRIIAAIRERYGKGDCGLVTIEDFCSYTGLKEERVRAMLG